MRARFSAWLSGISPKLYAAVAGAGGGVAVQQFALWGLGVWLWDAPMDAGSAQAAIDAVPGPVAGAVGVALIAVGVVVGAYAAPSSPVPPPEHDHLDGWPEPIEADRVDPGVDNTEPLGRRKAA